MSVLPAHPTNNPMDDNTQQIMDLIQSAQIDLQMAWTLYDNDKPWKGDNYLDAALETISKITALRPPK